MLVRTIRIASLVPLLLATLLTADALAFKPLKEGKWTFQMATEAEGVVLAVDAHERWHRETAGRVAAALAALDVRARALAAGS